MSETSYGIAGVVILYNPENHVYSEILSYVNQVSRLYIIDNSTQHNASLVNQVLQISHVNYINNASNIGIAAALNIGANSAITDGFDFLLTMDQDTSLPGNYVATLVDGIRRQNSNEIGIIAPRYTPTSRGQDEFENVLVTMTSGNLLNLSVYKKVGPFLTELFIDHVDHEYCLRINREGFRVVQANNLYLPHRPGKLVGVRFIRKKLFSSHSPARLYYFCRNGFFVSNLYRSSFPEFRLSFIKLMAKEIVKIVFEDDRMLRLKMLRKAFLDFKAEKLGPLKLS